ncbi:C-type lectin domain family 17, member A-like [Homarus americanus]|uniref:C-type lectin-like 27 n=1 Tax=Homarus americanus TaxID=6706 RepID=A0A8J5JR28_HOMAM|nr:C-type lectin domain family 17, member A-like [Homarus americanus]KAG7160135.1 C-type lectin-like 27 [Homarus americanus]
MRGISCLVAVILVAGCYGCDPGWVDIEGSCYMFHMSTAMPWSDARAFCQESGADLAKVIDSNVHRAFWEYIHTYGLSGSFWLGASDEAVEGDWLWVFDNTRVEKGTNYWALRTTVLGGYQLEPSGGSQENCLALDEGRKHYFNDAACETSYHPICMK